MKIRCSLLFICVSFSAWAQSAGEAEVMMPIARLFTGMNQSDSAMVRSAFAKQITMATVMRDKSGNVVLKREDSLDDFLVSIATPRTEPLSEPIWDASINIEGDLAQVWTKYAFYIGKKFSHCGVDVFQLIKEHGEWKIFHLADTRQQEGCDVPKSISDLFK